MRGDMQLAKGPRIEKMHTFLRLTTVLNECIYSTPKSYPSLMLRAKQNRSYWRNQQCRCVHDNMLLKSLTAASLMQLRNEATRQHDSYSRLILSRRHSQSEQSSIESIGSKRASARNCASAKNQNRISKSCVPHSCAV